jgi:hypothetical protein
MLDKYYFDHCFELEFVSLSIHWGVYSTPAWVWTAGQLDFCKHATDYLQAPPGSYAEWYEYV